MPINGAPPPEDSTKPQTNPDHSGAPAQPAATKTFSYRPTAFGANESVTGSTPSQTDGNRANGDPRQSHGRMDPAPTRSQNTISEISRLAPPAQEPAATERSATAPTPPATETTAEPATPPAPPTPPATETAAEPATPPAPPATEPPTPPATESGAASPASVVSAIRAIDRRTLTGSADNVGAEAVRRQQEVDGRIRRQTTGFLILVSLVALSMMVLGASSLSAIQHLNERSVESREAIAEVNLRLSNINREILLLDGQQKNLVLRAGETTASAGLNPYEQWQLGLGRVRDELFAMEQLTGLTPELASEIIRLEEHLDTYTKRATPLMEFAQQTMRKRQSDPTSASISSADLNRMFVPIRPLLFGVMSGVEATVGEVEQMQRAEIEKTERDVWRTASILMFTGIALALLASVIAARFHASNKATLNSLAELRLIDPLTGVMNRIGFRAVFEQRNHNRHSHDDRYEAIVIADLDFFQIINDTAGHTAGDSLLRLLSTAIASRIEEGETLARIGSNEFALLLSRDSLEDVESWASLLLSDIRNLNFEIDATPCRLTATIGIGTISDSTSSFDDVLATGEAALLMAKRLGRDRYATLNDSIPADGDENIRVTMQHVKRLQHVLEHDDARLAFQRIDALGAGSNRCELLLRFIDHTTGEISGPYDLITPAEQFGMMHELDRWVVKRALAHMAAGDLDEFDKVCVNLSGHSIGFEEFQVFVVEMLRRYPDQVSRLTFEITETAIIRDLDAARRFMNATSSLGVDFSIDDFGVGTASYAMLRALSFDTLKIDGQFVDKMIIDTTDREVVRSFTRVARTLKMTTVAERVENEEQIDALRMLGVDYVQGFGLHRPELLPTDRLDLLAI